VSDFSACFLLIFGQMAVGGLFALAIPPFAVIERGFFKSTAALFLACALLFLAGRVDLVLRRDEGLAGAGTLVELGAWLAFVVALARYLWTLWGEAGARVARAYVTALAAGTVALSATAPPSRRVSSGTSSTCRRSSPARSPSARWRPGSASGTGT